MILLLTRDVSKWRKILAAGYSGNKKGILEVKKQQVLMNLLFF